MVSAIKYMYLIILVLYMYSEVQLCLISDFKQNV